MDVLLYLIGIAACVAVLVKSADVFTDAAVEMARRFRIPAIVVGATIVSLATTLPEFAVSFTATIRGQVDMAVGNAVGSTICNIGLILGFCALLAPMGIARRGFLANSLGLLAFAGVFGTLECWLPEGSRLTGAAMLACLAIYLALTLRASLRERSASDGAVAGKAVMSSGKMCLLFIAGAAGIVGGSNLMLYCAEHLARLMGVSELVISLTLLALGTSTPEFVVSVAGIIKKQRALAIGNIIGANILNLAWVLGTCSLVRPLPLQKSQVWGHEVYQSLVFDIPVMLLLSVLLLLFGLTGQRLSRWEGAILFAIYITYVLLLFVVFGPAAT